MYRMFMLAVALVASLTIACDGNEGPPPTAVDDARTPTSPVPTAEPPPTVEPPPSHPRDVRTGVRELDTVIADLVSGDPVALAARLRFRTERCGEGWVPCDAGTEQGTEIETFTYVLCDIGWIRPTQESGQRLARGLGGAVYAVYGAPVDARDGARWTVITVDPARTPAAIYVSEDGDIVDAGYNCGDSLTGFLDTFVRDALDEVILAPISALGLTPDQPYPPSAYSPRSRT